MKKNIPQNTSPSFSQKILSIVRKIPRGRVLSYGQVASIAGLPRAARMVGGILFQQKEGDKLPWQRVINSQGGISTYRIGFGDKQRALLEAEGIAFDAQGFTDLQKYQWRPSEKLLKSLVCSDEEARELSFKFRL